jgi:hypothetical protein
MEKNRPLRAPRALKGRNFQNLKPYCKTTKLDESFDTSNAEIGPQIREE